MADQVVHGVIVGAQSVVGIDRWAEMVLGPGICTFEGCLGFLEGGGRWAVSPLRTRSSDRFAA